MMKDMSSLMGVGGGFLTPSLPLFVFALSLNWIHTQMGWEGRRDGGTEVRYGTFTLDADMRGRIHNTQGMP